MDDVRNFSRKNGPANEDIVNRLRESKMKTIVSVASRNDDFGSAL